MTLGDKRSAERSKRKARRKMMNKYLGRSKKRKY